MEPLKPQPEGVKFTGPPVDQRGRVKKYELKTGQAKALLELQADYAFFTPAVLYLNGFTDAPLIDFMFDMGEEVKFFYKKFRHPLFRGLEARSNGNPDWNFVLWAVELPFWQAVSDFLVSLTLKESDHKRVLGIGEQFFTILDPLAVDLCRFYHKGLTMLPVTAFGINGSDFREALVVGTDPLMEPPILRRFAGDPAMQVFASALYGGGNPVNAKNDFRRLQQYGEKRHEDPLGDRSRHGR